MFTILYLNNLTKLGNSNLNSKYLHFTLTFLKELILLSIVGTNNDVCMSYIRNKSSWYP